MMFTKFKRLSLWAMLVCGAGSFLSVFAMEEPDLQQKISCDAEILSEQLSSAFDALCNDDVSAAIEKLEYASENWNRLQTVLLSTGWYPVLMARACKEISSKFKLDASVELGKNIATVVQLRDSIEKLLKTVARRAKGFPHFKPIAPRTFEELYKRKCKVIRDTHKVEREERLKLFQEQRAERIKKIEDVVIKQIDDLCEREETLSLQHKFYIQAEVAKRLNQFENEVRDYYGSIFKSLQSNPDCYDEKALRFELSKIFNEKYKQRLEQGLALDLYKGIFFVSKELLPEVKTEFSDFGLNIAEAELYINNFEKRIKLDYINKQRGGISDAHSGVNLLDEAVLSIKICHDCLNQLNPSIGSLLLTKIGFLKVDILSNCRVRACFEGHYNRLMAIEKLLPFGDVSVKSKIETIIADKMLVFFSPEKMFDVLVDLKDDERKTIARNLRKKWQDLWLDREDAENTIDKYQKQIDCCCRELEKAPFDQAADEYNYLKHAQVEAQKHLDKCKAIFNKYNNPGLLSEDPLLIEAWKDACDKGDFKHLSEYDQKTFADEDELIREWISVFEESLFVTDIYAPRVNLVTFVEHYKTNPTDSEYSQKLNELKKKINTNVGPWSSWFAGQAFLWRDTYIVSWLSKLPQSFLGKLIPQIKMLSDKGLPPDQILKIFNLIINSTGDFGKVFCDTIAKDLIAYPEESKQLVLNLVDMFSKKQQFLDPIKMFTYKNVVTPLLNETGDVLNYLGAAGKKSVLKYTSHVQKKVTTNVLNVQKIVQDIPEETTKLVATSLEWRESKTLAWLLSLKWSSNVIEQLSPEIGTLLKELSDMGFMPDQLLALANVVINSTDIGRALFALFVKNAKNKPQLMKKHANTLIQTISTLANGACSCADEAAELFKKELCKVDAMLDPYRWQALVGGCSLQMRQSFAEDVAKKFVGMEKPSSFKLDIDNLQIEAPIKDFVWSSVKKSNAAANKLRRSALNLDKDAREEIYQKYFAKCFLSELEQKQQRLTKKVYEKKDEFIEKTRAVVDELALVRDQKAKLANSMHWYQYLWLPSVFKYWEQDSFLREREERLSCNLISHTTTVLEKIKNMRWYHYLWLPNILLGAQQPVYAKILEDLKKDELENNLNTTRFKECCIEKIKYLGALRNKLALSAVKI